MPDQKKPTDTEESGKELDADQLENVAGGLQTEQIDSVFKFFRPNPAGDGTSIKEAFPTETITPALKK